MEFENLIDLIGRSVHDSSFKKVLEELDIQEIPNAKFKGYISITTIPDMEIPHIYNKDWGLGFRFMARRGWNEEDLKSSFTDDEYELIVRQVSFDKLVESRAYPFGCVFGDEDKTVSRKIGEKSSAKSKAIPDGFVYYYYKDNLEILTYFDDNKRLRYFNASLQDSITKKNRKQKAALSTQKDNLTVDHLQELRAFAGTMPSEAWRIRMHEEAKENEPARFTNNSIDNTRIVLKLFLSDLESAVIDKKVVLIQSAIKKAVRALNKLNAKESFIDTMEREELVEFITNAVRLTGFKIEPGADLTEDWRDW